MGRYLLAILICWILPADAVVTLTGSGKSYSVIEKSNHKKLIEGLRLEAGKIERPVGVSVMLKEQPEVARETRVRRVGTTYTQPHDVVNREGKIIVAKGKKIEPLSFLKLPVLIVVNADPIQLRWAREKRQEIKEQVYVLLSGGSAWEVAEKYHMRVYHLSDRIMRRFNIKRVPCIIRQKGIELEIHEYSL